MRFAIAVCDVCDAAVELSRHGHCRSLRFCILSLSGYCDCLFACCVFAVSVCLSNPCLSFGVCACTCASVMSSLENGIESESE